MKKDNFTNFTRPVCSIASSHKALFFLQYLASNNTTNDDHQYQHACYHHYLLLQNHKYMLHVKTAD